MKDKILSLIIISIIMLITVSCGTAANTPEETDKKEVSEAGEGAYETLNIIPFNERKFIYRNGLNVEYKEETSDDNNKKISKYYPQISGLINKEVEKKVNDSIIMSADNMNKKAEALIASINTDINTDISSYTNTFIHYSCNNVIFIEYFCNASCEKNLNPDLSVYVSANGADGFDLNTGNRLELKDLFKKESDYGSIINNYIFMEIIRYNYDDPDSMFMKKPFQGIKENQSFSFNENYLTIIMDENNDEFNTSENSIQIAIPTEEIGDKLAIFDRYFNEDINIFENYRYKKLMPNPMYCNVKGSILDEGENYRIQIEAGEFMNMKNTEIKNMFDNMISQNMDVNGFKERAGAFALSNPGAFYGFMNHNISVEMSEGGYLSMTVGSLVAEDGEIKSEDKFINYDFNNNKFMTFKDLFVDGFDYKTKIIKFIKEDNDYSNPSLIIDPDDIIFSEDEFYFNQNYIYINLSKPVQYLHNNYAWFSCEDIGLENISIFQ